MEARDSEIVDNQSMEHRQEEAVPDVTVQLTLDPTVHSYQNSCAPRLRLTLTSHTDRPITIYSEAGAVYPGRLLRKGTFSIFDITRNVEVPQQTARFCDFAPPSKVDVPLRESLFHTLYPDEPVIFEAVFGRGMRAPKAIHDPDFVIDSKHPHQRAMGVDGLESGHHYRLKSKVRYISIRWWEYGEKEEVMNPPTGKLDGRTVAYRRNKNPHPPLRLDMESIPSIDFWCTD